MDKFTFNDVCIIIVLYECKIKDSIIFKSIADDFEINKRRLRIIVYDNSAESQVIPDYFENSFEMSYLHDATNPGISKAYNMSANLASQDKKTWIILFDQDTEVSINFLDCYLRAFSQNHEIKLFSPVLVSNDIIISPATFKYRNGTPPKRITVGVNSLKKNSPLNSGIGVSLETFMEVGGYNEKVPLDYSDYAFIDRFKRHSLTFFVLDLKFLHGLSSHEIVSLDASMFRFKMFCIGLINSSESKKDLAFSFFIALKRCIKLTIQNKKLIYLKILSGKFIFRY